MNKLVFYKQSTEYSCGAASMRMALEFCGIRKSEKQIATLLCTNKVRGTWHRNFPIIAEKFRLNYVSMRNATIDDLKDYKKKGFAVIVCYFYPTEKVNHYSLLKKIDDKFIHFLDPFFGETHKYSLSYFKKIWRSDPKYDNEKRWLFAVNKNVG